MNSLHFYIYHLEESGLGFKKEDSDNDDDESDDSKKEEMHEYPVILQGLVSTTPTRSRLFVLWNWYVVYNILLSEPV